MQDIKKADIQEMSLEFTKDVLQLVKKSGSDQKQLMQGFFLSAAGVGSGIEEARAGNERLDFLHGMQKALQAAAATKFWLKVLKDAHIDQKSVDSYEATLTTISKILAKIIKTTAENIVGNK